MISKRFFQTLTAFWLAGAWATNSYATTREELENRLYKNSLELKSLESEITSQTELKKSVYAGFLPSLNLVGGWAQEHTDDEDNEGRVGYAEGSFNLFSGFKDVHSATIESRKSELTRANYDLQKQKLQQELTEIMTTMVGLHQLEKILDEEYKVTQVQRAMAAKKVNAGLTSNVDNYEFDLRESEIQIQRRNNAQLHAEAHEKLNALFNDEIKDEDIAAIDFLKVEKLVNILELKNFENHPDIRKATLEQEVAELEKKNMTAEFLPKIDLNYAFGRLTPSKEQTDYNEKQVALLVTIPLFSGFETYWRRKAAVASAFAREKSAAQVKLNTKASFESLKSKFSELIDLFYIYQKKAVSAEKYYNLTLAEYKRGVKNSPDIVGATERYFESKKKAIDLQKEIELTYLKLSQYK